MSKYYKYHNRNLVVKWVRDNVDDYFTGIVVWVGNSVWKLKDQDDYFQMTYFEPYTPTPQELIEWGETATLTNYNPNKVEVDDKDVNLRLKCLELAIMGYNTDAIDKANEFYEWITQKPLTNSAELLNLIAKP